ncbi:helix-hairpin-helix domain-containing protein [Candidatus Saccharibacteria bacterium]|nr:helix-hairpin-helix domain-containing protein [Candidatus Saccharibacteria bacterium]
MHEVISRRFSERNIKSWGMPDLITIDGGRGQLDAGLRALEERGVSVPAISIAKREEEVIVHRSRSGIGVEGLEARAAARPSAFALTKTGEYDVLNLHPGQRNASGHSKNLRGGDVGLQYTHVVKLFQRIRDESHRFAISYHSVLKRGKQTASKLEDIPGVGPATRRKLIRAFGSMRGVTAASEEELEKVVGSERAKAIGRHLLGS